MIIFLIGLVFGSAVTFFVLVLCFTSKKADLIEADYYRKYLHSVANNIKAIIQKYKNKEISIEDTLEQIENELK